MDRLLVSPYFIARRYEACVVGEWLKGEKCQRMRELPKTKKKRGYIRVIPAEPASSASFHAITQSHNHTLFSLLHRLANSFVSPIISPLIHIELVYLLCPRLAFLRFQPLSLSLSLDPSSSADQNQPPSSSSSSSLAATTLVSHKLQVCDRCTSPIPPMFFLLCSISVALSCTTKISNSFCSSLLFLASPCLSRLQLSGCCLVPMSLQLLA